MGKITFSGLREMGKAVKPAVSKKTPAYSPYGRTFWIEKIKDLFTADTLILDTETTGIKGDVRITELSIIDMEGNVLFNSLFNPGIPSSPDAIRISGLTDELLAAEPFFYEKCWDISALLEEHTLVAWNADFDRKHLYNELARAGQASLFPSVRWVDAMELYAFATGRDKKWCKLILAKEELELGDSQEHRATGDCLDTLAVLKKLVELAENNEQKEEA